MDREGIKVSDITVICRECGRPEYWGETRWLNNRCLCRTCFQNQYRIMYHKEYTMDNLDGKKPSNQEYLKQQNTGR